MRLSSSVNALFEDEALCISFLTQLAFRQKYAVAVWRLPYEQETHLILAKDIHVYDEKFVLEDLPEGFVFAPFDKSQRVTYLPADFAFRFKNGKMELPKSLLESSSRNWLEDQSERANDAGRHTPYYRARHVEASSKEHFITFVEAALAAIERQSFEKVVASRTKRIPLDANFDYVATFQKLAATYPHALISFVSSPETGTWMGATPEVLVTLEGGATFKTVALAGTQPYIPGMNLKSVAWTQKEIEEQALVERYIISCFKKIRLREYDEQGPKTVVAGNLLHLKSDFTVDLKETNFPQLGTVMLQLLHPTSAVCGMPMDAALQFLVEHEGYDRDFYAGYLGPVNYNHQTNIYVNLRCMQMKAGEAILYAGAGITADSVPEKEWLETEMKINTLLRVIYDKPNEIKL